MTDGFETTATVRYGDLDTYGHVNNAVYATLVEEARIDYFETVLEVGAEVSGLEGSTGTVVADLQLSFEAPLQRTGDVTVVVRVPELGDSSMQFTYEIRDGDTVVATGKTTLVVIDRESGESKPIPTAWRERIESD
jgi:acyl-CoA thioester hydrolase